LGTREARQRDPHRGHRRNPDHLVTIGEPRGGVNTFEPNYRFEVPNGPTPRCAGALTISLGCAVSWRRALLASKRPCSLDQETLLTFAACRPFGPCVTSKDTRWPSSSVRKPLPAIAE